MSATDNTQMAKCSLCGGPVEVWPGHEDDPEAAFKRGFYGNNPEPLAAVGERCCNRCNTEKVIPARIAGISLGKPIGRDS